MADRESVPFTGVDSAFASRRWAIVLILFLVQMVNWADKTVVSLAATEIMAEFGLGTEEYGIIGGAFFSLYAATGLVVAFAVAPRFKPRKILLVLLLCWSIVQIPIVVAASFPVLIICRILLGMGEGAATPTALNATHEWFDNTGRSMPTAIVLFGATFGSMVAAPVLTAVIQAYGWRASFLACAIFGMVVLILWLLVGRDGPYVASRGEGAERALTSTKPLESALAKKLWTDPTLIGVTIAGLTAYWLTAFQVSWLAPYLMAVTHDAQYAAWLLSLIYAIQASCVLGLSFMSQLLLSRGVSSQLARGAAMGCALLSSGLCFEPRRDCRRQKFVSHAAIC